MGLDRRHLDDVAPDKDLGDAHPFGVDLIKYQERTFRLVAHPIVLRLVEVDVAHAVLVDHVFVLVVLLAHVGVDDDGVVVGGDEVLVASALQCLDRSFQLPGGGRAGRIPGLPGDVDLEDRFSVLWQGLSKAGQFHHVDVIRQHRLWPGPEDRHFASTGEISAHSSSDDSIVWRVYITCG